MSCHSDRRSSRWPTVSSRSVTGCSGSAATSGRAVAWPCVRGTAYWPYAQPADGDSIRPCTTRCTKSRESGGRQLRGTTKIEPRVAAAKRRTHVPKRNMRVRFPSSALQQNPWSGPHRPPGRKSNTSLSRPACPQRAPKSRDEHRLGHPLSPSRGRPRSPSRP